MQLVLVFPVDTYGIKFLLSFLLEFETNKQYTNFYNITSIYQYTKYVNISNSVSSRNWN